jgi:tRNA-splicing endonuclease subunit Sen2
VLTAEEATAVRRKERRDLKIQKAKEKAALASGIASPASPAPSAGPRSPDVQVASTSKKILEDATDTELSKELEIIENLEHLQLQREEALFLVFGVGCLDIYIPDVCIALSRTVVRAPTELWLQRTNPLSLPEVWSLFLSPSGPPRQPLRPDDPFLISYVVYHHYRSLGWVARSGVKFCTDWVLYKGADGSGRGGAGPVGGHAECAVCL